MQFPKERKSSHDGQYCQLRNIIYTHCQTTNSFCLPFHNQWWLKPANSGKIATIKLTICWNIRTARGRTDTLKRDSGWTSFVVLVLIGFLFVCFLNQAIGWITPTSGIKPPSLPSSSTLLLWCQERVSPKGSLYSPLKLWRKRL